MNKKVDYSCYVTSSPAQCGCSAHDPETFVTTQEGQTHCAVAKALMLQFTMKTSLPYLLTSFSFLVFPPLLPASKTRTQRRAH